MSEFIDELQKKFAEEINDKINKAIKVAIIVTVKELRPDLDPEAFYRDFEQRAKENL